MNTLVDQTMNVCEDLLDEAKLVISDMFLTSDNANIGDHNIIVDHTLVGEDNSCNDLSDVDNAGMCQHTCSTPLKVGGERCKSRLLVNKGRVPWMGRADEVDFLGFNGSSPSLERHNEILNEMKNLLSDSRRVLAEHSERSVDFRRESFRRHNINVTDASSVIISEASDILTDFRDLPCSTPRRVLRSGGSVPLLPNVQPRTIEFKRRFQS